MLLFLLVFFIGCSTEKPSGASLEKKSFFREEKKLVAVTAYVVPAREIPLVVDADGKTEASERYLAKAPTNIKIQKVFVEEGTRVQAGDPLVKFDDREAILRLAKARAEIREAEAGIANDNFMKQNQERLIEEGKISELEAEWLEDRIGLWEATIERAKAEVELYENLPDLTQLNSPIAGVVTKETTNEGADVAEDQELVEVVRLDPIQFVFNVPVEAISVFEKGAEITVKFSAFSGQEFTGEVASVGAEAKSEEGGKVSVRLNIPNPELAIKAEMPGEVIIRTQARIKVLPIIESALIKTERSTYVYKIEGTRIRRVPVELGDAYNGQPTVEKGLSEGDLIVATTEEEELKDGMQVEIQGTRAEK